MIRKRVQEEKLLSLIDRMVDSFKKQGVPEKGIPLGNVTSQLFANIYLHELDLFVKQQLRERYYLRYCDDIIFLSKDKDHLLQLVEVIRDFLATHLRLELHPKKVVIRKLSQGIDFVGYVFFSRHRLLRTRTKKWIKAAYVSYLKGTIDAQSMDQRLQSYVGILSHASQERLSQALKNAY